MEKKKTRYQWILYIALLFFIMLLETTLLPYLKIFGATPMYLLPYAIGAIAMFEGAYGGAVAGLAAGLISDAMLPVADGFYTVVYVLCGVFVAFLSEFVFWRNYAATLLYGAVIVLLTRLFYYVVFFLIYGETNILMVLTSLPAELLASAVVTPLIYPVICGISRRFHVEEEA